MPRFVEAFPHSGVDELANWMMVPAGGYNYVILKEGKHLTLEYPTERLRVEEIRKKDNIGSTSQLMSDQRIIRAYQSLDEKARMFVVHGKVRGLSLIRAKNNRAIQATLEVSVTRKLNLNVAFHLVKHKSTNASTNVDFQQVDKIIAGANTILEPQANICVLKHQARWVTVDFDSPVVYVSDKSSKMASNWGNLMQQVDPTAYANVFWIHTLKTELPKNALSPLFGLTIDTNIAVANGGHDTNELHSRALAHEICHLCGVDPSWDDYRNDSISIMGRAPGIKFTKTIANKVNPGY